MTSKYFNDVMITSLKKLLGYGYRVFPVNEAETDLSKSTELNDTQENRTLFMKKWIDNRITFHEEYFNMKSKHFVFIDNADHNVLLYSSS